MAKRRRHSCRKGLWTTGSLHKVVTAFVVAVSKASVNAHRVAPGTPSRLPHALLPHHDRRFRGADRGDSGIVLHHVGSTPPLSAFENALAKAVIILKTRLNAMQDRARDNSGDKSECSFLERTRILSMA